jgi:predicted peptidase
MQILETNLHSSKSFRLRYLLHLPPEARQATEKTWPAILFLHGLGQSGDDPTAVLQIGLPHHVAQHDDFPFVVIAPQCPWNTWWPELAEWLDRLLVEGASSLPIDPRRVYLTGLSMGGFGTWYLGALWPQRFAAVAPICGGGYWFHGFPQRVANLRHIPVWAFHGARDDVVPLAESERLVHELQAAGGEVKFTVYPHAGHDSWTETYRNPELYEWFLSHRLKGGA